MGSNQFQREYIEYLQKKNSELLDKLNFMKESYENKILSKDLNKDYLISTLEEVLNTCQILPQEIDSFFDKITAAMGVFKDILLRKSEIMQLMEKISRMLNRSDDFRREYLPTDISGLFKEQFSESKLGKKVGPVKVSPMINGHVISTEPRIYLSRVPRGFTPGSRDNAFQLSPIIEASPDTSSDRSDLGSQIFKKITIPLERLDINKLSYGYISEESPRSRFKGPKTWKKTLLSNKHNSGSQRNSVSLENNEVVNRNLSVREDELPQESEALDPLEGPSWLYEENSELNSSSRHFVDFRRRKHRFATVFDTENCLNYFERKSKKSLKDSTKVFENPLETNDEEDNREIRERVSESSEDYICESFSRGHNEHYSPNNGERRNCTREFKEDFDENCSSDKFEDDLEKITSTPYLKSKKKKKSCTSANSKSSPELKMNEKKFKKVLNDEKFSTSPKLSREKKSEELFFEQTPRETNYDEGKTGRSKCRKNSRSLGENAMGNKVFVEVEDCLIDENRLSKSNTSNSKSDFPSEKKKLKRSKSKSSSESSIVHPQENPGRPKRKATNNISLVERSLKIKLRRE